jgi:hypothetical protein
MSVIFPVISRYTGYRETIEVTRPLSDRTRDKVIGLAAKYGWGLEHGCQDSLLLTDERGTGELRFRTSAEDKVFLVFGVKGQITYCALGRWHGRAVHNKRYEAVAQFLADNTVNPDGDHDLPERIGVTRDVALDLVRKVWTAGCVEYTVGDVTYKLVPSQIEDSNEIWALKVEA